MLPPCGPWFRPPCGKNCLSTWTATTACGIFTLTVAEELFVMKRLASFALCGMTVVSMVPSSIASNRSTFVAWGSTVSFLMGCLPACNGAANRQSERQMTRERDSACMAMLLGGDETDGYRSYARNWKVARMAG